MIRSILLLAIVATVAIPATAVIALVAVMGGGSEKPLGKALAAGSWDRTVRVWDLVAGR
jgi:hypothetical protein